MANSAETRCEGYSHKLEGLEAREYLRTRGESESLRKGSTWDHIKERIRMNAKEVHQPVDPWEPSYKMNQDKWIASIPSLLRCCDERVAMDINELLFREYGMTLQGGDYPVQGIRVIKTEVHEYSLRWTRFDVYFRFKFLTEDGRTCELWAMKEFDSAKRKDRHVQWLQSFMDSSCEAEENQLEFQF